MKRLRFAAAALVGLFAVAAHADTLNGQSGTVNYLLPDQSTILASQSFTAPQTVSFFDEILNEITSGNDINITFTVPSGSSFDPSSFNGEQFILPGFDIIAAGVLTNLVGTQFSFDQHDLFINWGSVAQEITPDSFATITVVGQAGAVPAPEPGSLLLMGSGLLAGAGAIRRKLQS